MCTSLLQACVIGTIIWRRLDFKVEAKRAIELVGREASGRVLPPAAEPPEPRGRMVRPTQGLFGQKRLPSGSALGVCVVGHSQDTAGSHCGLTLG